MAASSSMFSALCPLSRLDIRERDSPTCWAISPTAILCRPISALTSAAIRWELDLFM